MRTPLIAAAAALALAGACSAQTEDAAAETEELGGPDTSAGAAADVGVEMLTEGEAAAPAFEIEAPSGAYVLDKNHASLTWKIWHVGMSHYTARFDDFDAELVFDAEDPSASTLSVTVDPSSVDLDYEGEKDFKAELLEDPRFFRVAEFPTISFVATSIDVTGADTGVITGDLTFMGQTHPVALDVTLNAAYAQHPFTGRGALGFTARGVVTRSEFGMDFGAPNILSDEVEIVIQAEFNQPAG